MVMVHATLWSEIQNCSISWRAMQRYASSELQGLLVACQLLQGLHVAYQVLQGPLVAVCYDRCIGTFNCLQPYIWEDCVVLDCWVMTLVFPLIFITFVMNTTWLQIWVSTFWVNHNHVHLVVCCASWWVEWEGMGEVGEQLLCTLIEMPFMSQLLWIYRYAHS